MLSTECLGPGLELNYFSKLLVPSEGRNQSLRHRVQNIRRNMQIMIFRLRKNPFHPFSLLCTTQKNYDNFCLIFCDFLVPILTVANQRKWHFIFFLHEGHSAMVQKNYQTEPCHFGTYTKSFSFLQPMCTEI